MEFAVSGCLHLTVKNVKIGEYENTWEAMFISSQDNLKMIKNDQQVLPKIIVVTVILVLLALSLLFKPVYEVTLGGEIVGYINQKSEFVDSINEFLTVEDSNIAYIDMQEKPECTLKFVSRQVEVDNEKVYNDVIASAYIYNRVLSIFANDKEIALVSSDNDSEALIEEISKTANNKNVVFTVKEANLINPQIMEKEDLVALVNDEYKVSTKKTVLSTVKRTENVISTDIDFETPLRGIITSRYGYRGSELHTGIDIANDFDTPIYAAAKGEVIFSGTRGNYGHVVILQHDNDMITYYAHCNKLLVEEGDLVELGDQIATIGMTGRTTGPHLHFEVRVGGHNVNPESYIKNIGK